MNDRLYRSRDDRIIAGVAGGLAEALDIDPSIVRVAWAILALLSGGILIIVYIIMAIVVPEAPEGWTGWQPRRWDPWAPPAGAPPAPAPGATAPGTAPGTAPAAEAPGAEAPGAGDWRAARASERQARREARYAARAARRAGRSGSGGIIFGLILVLIGGYLLLREVAPAADVDRWWPLALIGVGVLLLIGSVLPGRGPE